MLKRRIDMATTSLEDDMEREKGLAGILMVAGVHWASSAGWMWRVSSQAAEMTREYFWL